MVATNKTAFCLWTGHQHPTVCEEETWHEGCGLCACLATQLPSLTSLRMHVPCIQASCNVLLQNGTRDNDDHGKCSRLFLMDAHLGMPSLCEARVTQLRSKRCILSELLRVLKHFDGYQWIPPSRVFTEGARVLHALRATLWVGTASGTGSLSLRPFGVGENVQKSPHQSPSCSPYLRLSVGAPRFVVLLRCCY